MAYTQLTPRHTKYARVEEISGVASQYRLSIPAGKAGQYRLAQLDDYTQLKRGDFPLRFPLSLTISARTSSDSIPGTWGFGFWNDPFGWSLGFGGSPFRFPALPNAAWFFGASEESYLSFRDPHSASTGPPNLPPAPHERTVQAVPRTNGDSAQRRGAAANGFLAQTFHSPKFHLLLVAAGLAFPFSRKKTREMLSKVIGEAGIQLWSPAARRQGEELAPGLPGVDPTHWHRYRLDWRERRVSFEVDGAPVLESPVSPNPPLGLVIWIDNQYAAFTPEGKIGFGVLENPVPAWLEVKEIEVT